MTTKKLDEARTVLAELHAATEEAIDVVDSIDRSQRNGQQATADEDEAALRVSLRCIGEALINLAGKAS